MTCFDAYSNEKYTEDLNSTLSWQTYKSADEKLFKTQFKGTFATYSGDGYTLDIYPKNISYEQYQTMISEYFNMIDSSFTHVSVSFILYLQKFDLWVYVIVLIE